MNLPMLGQAESSSSAPEHVEGLSGRESHAEGPAERVDGLRDLVRQPAELPGVGWRGPSRT
jgi:hypothetical protein